MGICRAIDAQVGVLAVRLPVSATIIAAGLLLSACSSIGALTGAVTGAAAGGGSANPAVGYAVGIGSKAATDALVKYLSKKRQAKEQDLIAAQTGTMAVGSTAAWSIHHKIPLFDDEHGHVTVVRVVQNALTDCKEVFFTVERGKASRVVGRYTTSICLSSAGWRWAQAEPSTRRWGFLQ